MKGYKIVILFVMSIVFGCLIQSSTVRVYKNNTIISVALHEKNLALAGFTPHPTKYIAKNGYKYDDMRTIVLSDFLDVAYVRASCMELLSLSKASAIDHLVIAYLPIHFATIKGMLPESYLECCSVFLDAIVPQMATLIEECAHALACDFEISLSIPPIASMHEIPCSNPSAANRTRFLVKELPRLLNINDSQLDTITIINNAESISNEQIIDYLKYEYLYCKELHYSIIFMSTRTFHRYI
jgi:hypothetical protein